MILKSKLKEICKEDCAEIGFAVSDNSQKIFCKKAPGECDSQVGSGKNVLVIPMTLYQRREDQPERIENKPVCTKGLEACYKQIANYGRVK